MVTGSHGALERCRARIAVRWGGASQGDILGDIVLREDQREAVRRVRQMLDRYRGCVLADDVGRGKTFVALALASRWTRPLVVVPAALADTWRLAMSRAGVSHAMVTHEALSRGRLPFLDPDGVIVDESHHFRNPHIRRHAVLARLARRAELLLMSATPVQNSTADLAAQLTLFLGSSATSLGAERLAAFVVRVERGDTEAGLPSVDPPAWVPVPADDSGVLQAILDLPPPPRALDAGDAGALRTVSLVRAWASSRAALLATLSRRRRTALAMEQSLDAGRIPTRAELRSWHGSENDTVQLGFATLLATHEIVGLSGSQRTALHAAVHDEHQELARLASLLRQPPDVDRARADALLCIAREHATERVLAFTGLASTARAYHALLRQQPGVGLLTAAGALIASGRITRRELMARFAPAAHGCPEPPIRERLTLLISTDLLSEGVNLQDASVVVHLDLPWNPARIAQRVGRVRRPHGAARVRAFLLAPPAGAERILEVERRLRAKLAEAEHTIGRTIDVIPALTFAAACSTPAHRAGPASRRAALERRLRAWRHPDRDVLDDPSPLVAAVSSAHRGWLALTGQRRLVAAVDGRVGDDVALLDLASALADGASRPVDPGEASTARDALHTFLRRERLLADCGVRELVSPIARAVLRQAALRVAAAPRHDRPRATLALAPLRAALARPCPLGAERALRDMLEDRTEVDIITWIERALAVLPSASGRVGMPSDVDDSPTALLIVGP